MPASPASIPNDCFSWHTACLVDIHSPSANERNVETSHRLIRRPATRIDSLWHCASRLDGADPVSRPKCMSLACHKKNLEGSAHGCVVWRGWPTSIKIQVCQRSRGSPEARSDLLVNWNAAKLHSPNLNISWMSRCSGSRDGICKRADEYRRERGRVIALVSCRASVVGLKTFAGGIQERQTKNPANSRQTRGVLHPSTPRWERHASC